ncbi:MAG: hypothetical protein K6A33_12235 [Clostridiales bacterium]|nr:hypothetical protein [Clostridiales bacterium]
MFTKPNASAPRYRIGVLLLLLLLLAGCRKESGGLAVQPGPMSGGSTADGAGILTGVYRGEELIRPEGVYVDVSHLDPGGMRFDGETGDVTFWATDTEGRGRLLTVSGDKVTADVSFEIPEDRIVQTAAFGEHCFVWVTAIPADHKFAEEELNLLDLDTQEGKTVSNIRSFFAAAERFEADFGRFQILSSAVDADGDIWLASSGEVVVLSPDGVFLNSFVSRSYSSPLSVSPDGTVWIPSGDGAAVLDKKTGRESALRMNAEPSSFAFGDGYDYYYETDQGVFGADDTGSVLLMSYRNSNITQGSVRFCGVIDPETFLFAENGRLMRYEALGDIDLSAVPTVEVVLNVKSAMGFQRSMDIVEYNKSHPETRVIVTDYTQYDTKENPNAGTQRLSTDLLTGKIKPDIVIAETRSRIAPEAGAEIEMMIEHKLYTDLTGFLENDPALKPENLFGAARRYFTAEDGGMWGIASGFQMETLFGPTALLEQWADGNGSSKGWTLTEMLDFAESLPEDMYLMGPLHRETAANRLLGPDGYAAFIDRGSASCSFDGPDFLRWLRFLGTLPGIETARTSDTPDRVGLRADTVESYFTGRVALDSSDFTALDAAVESLEAQFGTKDWTIIGFPAEGHNGTYIQCDEAIMMTSFCTQKELAWDVIRNLVMGFEIGFPVLKQKYEENAAERLEHGDYMIMKLIHDENGWGTVKSRSAAPDKNFPTPDDLTSPGWISIPTAEDFARLEAFLDNDAGYPLTERVSPEVNAIIEEEISAYFAGVGSAEDCAKKIQSRVSIWLAEHR